MAMEVRQQFVILLQGDCSSNENKYVKVLKKEGIKARSIPTLSFNFINEGKLHDCLSNSDRYSGIIFTSTRSVNAISLTLNSSKDLSIGNWRQKHNFSVGKATADLAQSLLTLETQGSDSGNSEKLCNFIIEKGGQLSKPLVFPCSNIRKDTIPVILSENGISVEEIICYETVSNVQFDELWKNLIAEEGLPDVIVFFSPSGVQSCIKTIKETYSVLPKIISIGPSTEKSLLELNISCKTAEKPTPESVVCAVKTVLEI